MTARTRRKATKKPPATHTPGDWIVEQDTLGCKNIIAVHEDGREEPFFTLETNIGYTHGLANEDEDAANARLICAAPILLATLQSIFNLTSPGIKGWPTVKLDDAREMARDAIQLATTARFDRH